MRRYTVTYLLGGELYSNEVEHDTLVLFIQSIHDDNGQVLKAEFVIPTSVIGGPW